jgi:hypothetical protein
MLDSLWQILVSLTLFLMSLELLRLRREVTKCLRILYAAADADPDQEVPE